MKPHLLAHRDCARPSPLHWASIGFAAGGRLPRAPMHGVEHPGGGGGKPQWRSHLSTHVARNGTSVNRGHHAAVAAMGGNAIVTRLAVDKAHAWAPIGSVGSLDTSPITIRHAGGISFAGIRLHKTMPGLPARHTLQKVVASCRSVDAGSLHLAST